MKFYQTISVRERDEFTEYEGYDKQAAIDKAISVDGHLTPTGRKHGYTEVREFNIEKPYAEMDEDEQCDIICGGYNLISFNEVSDEKLDTPDRLAEAAGVSVSTVYNRAKELGRLPTLEELQKRKSTGRPRKYL
ncbi:MAG: helix-turn-helix domain-containing protein [Clostridia bacterium]|nr:helix-turn-helix domain-containing protein [Clostridia bacterium]